MDGRAFVIGCVVGGVVGGLGAIVFAPESGPSARTPARSPSLERRMDALAADVARVADSVEALNGGRVVSEQPARRPSEAAHQPIARPRAAPGPELAELAKVPTKSEALERIGSEHAENLAKQETWYAVSRSLTDEHLLRTYQDVLRAFGRPAAVRPTKGGAAFTYPLPVRGTRNRFNVTFTFVDGMVVAVEAMCSNFQEGR